MLTDIFADRYTDKVLWPSYGESEAKLLNQYFRIVIEQLCPYYVDGKEDQRAKDWWTDLHNRLSAELGVDELSPRHYSYRTEFMGKPSTQSGFWKMDHVCKQFVCAKPSANNSADRFVKERISFIELAFRKKDGEVQLQNYTLDARIRESIRSLGSHPYANKDQIAQARSESLRKSNAVIQDAFSRAVHELNERLRRANTPLNYHNGFLQIITDPKIEQIIEAPFWSIVANPKWRNVDIDMKEALDSRDSGGRDPAWYAARALESTIKIISDERKLTHGKEKGAFSYIENLASNRGGHFIAEWESTSLKHFFSDVRAQFGHGPGSAAMPTLTEMQTDWAIETAMSWIRSLVRRHE